MQPGAAKECLILPSGNLPEGRRLRSGPQAAAALLQSVLSGEEDSPLAGILKGKPGLQVGFRVHSQQRRRPPLALPVHLLVQVAERVEQIQQDCVESNAHSVLPGW